MQRIVTAVILLPFLWLLIKRAPPEVFLGIAAIGVTRATWECYRMLEAMGSRPLKWLGVLSACAVLLSFAGVPTSFDVMLPLAALALLTLVVAMWSRPDPRAMLDSTLTTLFPVLFVSVGLGFTVRLRGLPGETGTDSLLLLFGCVMAADIAAYYVGSAIGRHRMAPRISPKKSWEGAAAGIAGSVAAAVVGHLWFYKQLPLVHAMLLGLLLGFGSILGDLAESLVKRAAAVKDSSSLLPGHGGLLDRTDSLLFSGPILYYYSVALLQGRF